MATEKKGISVRDFEAALMELDGATEFINFMVYGDSGCGKTVLASSAPGPLLVLAGEPGYISMANVARKEAGMQPIVKGSKVRIIPDTATAVAACEYLERGGAGQYGWVIADGISTMQNKFLLNYAAEAFDANPAKRVHRNLPDKPDYYNAQNFMKSFVARLIDAPVNVLFTAHAMRPEGDEGERLVRPLIQGKGYEVSNYVAGLMHVVAYMAVRTHNGQRSRRLLFQEWHDELHDTTYFAKDQYDRLGFSQTVRDQDNLGGVMLPELVAMIEGDATKTTGRRSRRAA